MMGFLDVVNYVGSYEIWGADQINARDRFKYDDLDTPHLVQTGPATERAIKSEALDMAVRLLLDAKLPRQPFGSSQKEFIDLMSDDILHGEEVAVKKHAERRSGVTRLPREAFAEFENTVLKVAGRIGMLGQLGGPQPKTDSGYLRHESLERWLTAADSIHAMFYGADARRALPKDFVLSFGKLDILIGYRAGETEMRLRPEGLSSALFHHAGQMIARGTKLQDCENCHKPFLSGGTARGGGKRRGDARFCRDECRYSFHNEMRRRSTRKAKL
jgi:hypothetical protein